MIAVASLSNGSGAIEGKFSLFAILHLLPPKAAKNKDCPCGNGAELKSIAPGSRFPAKVLHYSF